MNINKYCFRHLMDDDAMSDNIFPSLLFDKAKTMIMFIYILPVLINMSEFIAPFQCV